MKKVVPDNKKLYPFQKEGVKFLARKRRSLLADQPGLGKTAQVIVTANVWKPKLIVVLCPASLVYNWANEFKMWSLLGYDSHIVGRKKQYNKERIIICSDHIDSINKLEALLSLLWPEESYCLFVDEAHRFSSWGAQRTQALCFRLLKRAEYLILITGTPMKNGDVAKLHPLASMCNPAKFGGYHTFVAAYSNAVWNGYTTVYQGVKDVGKLKKKMNDFMLRRFKKDVLKQLPPVVYNKHFVEIDKALCKRSLEYASYIDAILSNKKADAPEDPAYASIRKELGESKVDAVIDFCETLFDGGSGPILLFAHHRSVIDDLFKGLLIGKRDRVARLYGGDSPEKKQEVVEKFQAGKIDYLVMSITAMSVGVTLTKSSCVVFAEPVDDPADMIQAVDRANRIGAVSNTMVYYVVAKGSLDAKMYNRLKQKQKNIKQVVGT